MVCICRILAYKIDFDFDLLLIAWPKERVCPPEVPRRESLSEPFSRRCDGGSSDQEACANHGLDISSGEQNTPCTFK